MNRISLTAPSPTKELNLSFVTSQTHLHISFTTSDMFTYNYLRCNALKGAKLKALCYYNKRSTSVECT